MAIHKCDVVYGVQEKRKGGLFEQWSGNWFYKLFNMMTNVELPFNLTTARLMSQRYVRALLQHHEREMVISGLWVITGFEQKPFIVIKNRSSKTTYTLRKKISILINSVTSFSYKPLIFVFNMGIIIFMLSLFYIGYLIFNWLFLARPISGWTSLMASIWLLGGLIISFIGVVGIYVAKIFSETKQRPYTIVRALHHKDHKILTEVKNIKEDYAV